LNVVAKRCEELFPLLLELHFFVRRCTMNLDIDSTELSGRKQIVIELCENMSRLNDIELV
jgi:hypothetical protein